jgi:hypothetical protein
MRRVIATFCSTVAVLLGSAGISWSADPCNCSGYSGPGEPVYDTPGGQCYSSPGPIYPSICK